MYFKVNKQLSVQLKAVDDVRRSLVRDWHKYAKEIGAVSVGIVEHWGQWAVEAFEFASPPDLKKFKKVKGHEGYYTPRAGTKERKAMSAMRFELDSYCKPIGLEWFANGAIATPSFQFHKNGHCYVGTFKGFEPTIGCRRISDTTYEKFFPKKRKVLNRLREESQS